MFSPPAMDTFFLPPERLIEIRPGGVTLVSQSGGILVDLMIKLTQEGAGIARGLSIGNRAAVDEVDLIRFLADDPRTRVIGLYLEGFLPGRGRDFVELIRKTEKPVVFMKSGKTPGGSRAVASHTASVAGDYRVLHD
ncbi:MAG: CoA-binding protein, partial [Desulfomonilia bacterium]|nr:CoA-binding protein [Desulfomonilia bacterium]